MTDSTRTILAVYVVWHPNHAAGSKIAEADDKGLEHYLEKVQIFLSHSKHDRDGERIAESIRDWLHQNSGLSSFFDMIDIPAGVRLQDVLNHQVKASAVMAVHTDSYSAREWCRREIIEAKRQNVPMVVVNCMTDIDERGFPYMGNVPIVRMDPNETGRIEVVIGRLLEEVFKDFLWCCRVELAGRSNSGVLFMPRPPELISLANPAFTSFVNAELISDPALPADADAANPTIVYPDPPWGACSHLSAVNMLDRTQIGFFCSVRCPSDVILETYDLARALREADAAIIGGFQSAMEREFLDMLLWGTASIVVCPARGISRMRIPKSWRNPLAEGRLLIPSSFAAAIHRSTAALAAQRNAYGAALADRIPIPSRFRNSSMLSMRQAPNSHSNG